MKMKLASVQSFLNRLIKIYIDGWNCRICYKIIPEGRKRHKTVSWTTCRGRSVNIEIANAEKWLVEDTEWLKQL